jgi:amino acid transporter
MLLKKLRHIFFGKPQDPMAPETRKKVALVAFFAWVGLGADGLSSACYGPEQAFLGLGQHYHLALYLSLATILTVFLIATSYNQVIELFPNGGGGYKVATKLLGPNFGLVAGITLIMDYVLTVAISVASGADAIFSLLPQHFIHVKLLVEALALCLLLYMNIRGAKESIKFLLPIFLGFLLTHIVIIIIGVVWHGSELPVVIHQTVTETQKSVGLLGLMTVVALFLRAYSLGGSTYTGLEAVSNNVNILAEPRVRTGKWTMLYMAISLSLVASGIILLYLLWHVVPTPGKTLNAVVFGNILSQWHYGHLFLICLMIFEAGLLLIGANTGFLGGPQVLANMSLDQWVPRRFSSLSSRLVVQNGIVFIGLLALVTILITRGHVLLLAVLYSMNVFLTFTLSLFGLCVYWVNNRKKKRWWLKLLWVSLAFLVCISIFLITLVTRIEQGGWLTMLLLAIAMVMMIMIKRNYRRFNQMKLKLDQELEIPFTAADDMVAPEVNHAAPTAVFVVNSVGGAMHTILWIERMFPGNFKNYLFVDHGLVDVGSYGSEKSLESMSQQIDKRLAYLLRFSNKQGKAASVYSTCSTDYVDSVSDECEKIAKEFPEAVFFGSRYAAPKETFVTRLLHGDMASLVQRRLQAFGAKMLIVPITLGDG